MTFLAVEVHFLTQGDCAHAHHDIEVFFLALGIYVSHFFIFLESSHVILLEFDFPLWQCL